MKKYSPYIAVVLMVITLTSSLKIAGTMGYYAFFTEDFIENYCINKDRPELKCDGKCELAKLLLQEQSDEKTPINIDLLKTETVLYLESGINYTFLSFLSKNTTINEYTNHYNFNFLEKELRPPRV